MLIFGCIIADNANRRKRVWLLSAFLLRLAFLLYDSFGHNLPNSGADTEKFYLYATNYAVGISYPNYDLYSKFLGILFRFIGNNRYTAQYLNIVLGMCTVLVTQNSCRKLSIHEDITNTSIVLMMFLPNFALLNAVLLREAIISFALSLSLYCFINWFVNRSRMSLIYAYILLLFAMLFHSGSIAQGVGYLLVLITSKQNGKVVTRLLVYGAIAYALYYYLNKYFGSIFLNKFQNADSVADVAYLAEYGRGGSGYKVSFIHTGIANLDLVLNTPFRVFMFLFSPLPWNFRSINDIIAFVFSGFFYGSIILTSINLWYRNRDILSNEFTYLLLVSIMTVIVFSWGVSNAGTAMRHRDKFISLFIVMYALLSNERSRIQPYIPDVKESTCL
jgi:hypothetical protein